MTSLHARRSIGTFRFWMKIADDADRHPAPGIPRCLIALAHGEDYVACPPAEAREAITWVQSRPYWPEPVADGEAPVFVVETHSIW